jgi:glutamate synthase domain-containing protein 2
MPLTDGLLLVHNALTGVGLRSQVRLIAAGKIVTGFDMARRMALGADLCNAARPMMFALGCIQALRCNTNTCPVGVATQNPGLVVGLDPVSKAERVFNYQKHTVKSFLEILGAAGLDRPEDLKPKHIRRRVDSIKTLHYGQIYEFIPEGSLLGPLVPESFAESWAEANADSF